MPIAFRSHHAELELTPMHPTSTTSLPITINSRQTLPHHSHHNHFVGERTPAVCDATTADRYAYETEQNHWLMCNKCLTGVCSCRHGNAAMQTNDVR